ncbi:pyridoxamine 5'-phosphate oxidase family protein [Nocardia sp. NPDC057353]|uniref:pyridoxamine 5'-phosphate oxidase family protein n=1 Tax=Nocardia sp. NPDC057353 TaxID=3346104 RepID=UPI00363F8DDF
MRFHAGELAVQRAMGQAEIAERVGRSVRPDIPAVAADFLAAQRFLVLAGTARDGAVWASMLTGPPGFAHTADEHTVLIDTRPDPDDPLAPALTTAAPIGLIALQPQRRRRMRINGDAEPHGSGLRVTTQQVYSNCPKYIARRDVLAHRPAPPQPLRRRPDLNPAALTAIAAADTFFIASTDPAGRADASHRGGDPGFLRALSPTRLRWPDYRGNSMFMTLGNLATQPRCGLLVPDWTTGGTLQLTGTATINTDPATFAPGAQSSIDFTITEVVTRPRGPLRWGPPDPSPANPPVAGTGIPFEAGLPDGQLGRISPR